MPKFSETSKRRLSTCDAKLQVLFNKVVENFDCTVLCGHRGKEEQDEAYANGKSLVIFPNSKHNKLPSKAVDIMPYPLKWDDDENHFLFAGYVLATADYLGIKIIWGGRWKTLVDKPHWELIEECKTPTPISS